MLHYTYTHCIESVNIRPLYAICFFAKPNSPLSRKWTPHICLRHDEVMGNWKKKKTNRLNNTRKQTISGMLRRNQMKEMKEKEKRKKQTENFIKLKAWNVLSADCALKYNWNGFIDSDMPTFDVCLPYSNCTSMLDVPESKSSSLLLLSIWIVGETFAEALSMRIQNGWFRSRLKLSSNHKPTPWPKCTALLDFQSRKTKSQEKSIFCRDDRLHPGCSLHKSQRNLLTPLKCLFRVRTAAFEIIIKSVNAENKK